MLSLMPSDGAAPNLAAGLMQVTSVGVVVLLQVLWVGLFLFYGRSRVTGSVVSFHVLRKTCNPADRSACRDGPRMRK